MSGQIALNAEGSLVNETIVKETEQVMHNIEAILQEAEMSFYNVVQCNVYVKDLNNFAVINEIYGKYFPENPPARVTIEVSRLPKDAQVEISCIAVK